MAECGREISSLKQRACALAEERFQDLVAMADELYRNPELSGEEKESSRRLAGCLEQEGFQVEFGAGGLPTAFVARRATGNGPVVAYLAEYDALPQIGHGCGHNLIGTAAVGAAMAVAQVAAENRLPAQVRVVGTPAEETIGGKVILTDAGVFDDVAAALMVHPAQEDRVLTESLACQTLEVVFHGRGAHAVAHPEKGLNALDPLLSLFQARDALLRQHPTRSRIVGIVKEGGLRPNIIPERASGWFSLRAPCRTARDRLVGEFRHLATALGNAYRCRVEIRKTDGGYDEMVTNRALADAYRNNLRSLGCRVNDLPRDNQGSLDMGNVSYRVPSLHPFFAIVPPGIASHTRAFAEATISAAGRAGLLRSVKGLAMTGLDVLLDSRLRERSAAEHREFREAGSSGPPGG
ncbi:MAG: amidohydrolase [Acidobacteriota bacterium]